MSTHSVRRSRWAALAAACAAALSLAGASTLPGRVGGQDAATEQPLPSNVVIDIDAPPDTTFRMAVPALRGGTEAASTGTAVLRNDFRLMPGYQVVDPRSYPAAAAEGSVPISAWTALDADGVIEGTVTESNGRLAIELRFLWPARGGAAPALSRTYDARPALLRDRVHDFANEVLEVITGRRGPFGTKVAFARREGPRRKDVYCADMDGERLHRVSRPDGISMLPAFGLGHVWFTRMTLTGMYITHGEARDARLITGRSGVHMAPAICGDRVYFTSSRDGNSEIYSALPDGSDVRRLTNDPALDLSPTCGPGDTLAFVSTRHRTPQIFSMNRDGTNVRRLTFRGDHLQTPSFCPDPERRLLAFTARDQGAYDIFTLDLATQTYTRLTQGQGENKDPAWSPDCRMIAFSSDRRGASGLYLMSPQGNGQTRVVEGDVESVRWGRPAAVSAGGR